MASSWADDLKREWANCRLCPIGELAHNHVVGRGNIKAAVFFVGEGPGRSEDALGIPFVGRAGKLLEETIKATGNDHADCFYSNLVACRPADRFGGPNRPPIQGEIGNCSPRLLQQIRAVQPKAVVWLGRVPQAHSMDYRGQTKARFFNLFHPSYVLRSGGVKSAAFDFYVDRMREVFHYVKA